MASKAKEYAVHVGSFLVAGTLLWLALRGVDFDAMTSALAQANYWWLPPVVAVTLLSHWIRALRWALFLDVTTDRSGRVPDQPVSRPNAFISVMVGYMANYAGPRLGRSSEPPTQPVRKPGRSPRCSERSLLNGSWTWSLSDCFS